MKDLKTKEKLHISRYMMHIYELRNRITFVSREDDVEVRRIDSEPPKGNGLAMHGSIAISLTAIYRYLIHERAPCYHLDFGFFRLTVARLWNNNLTTSRLDRDCSIRFSVQF